MDSNLLIIAVAFAFLVAGTLAYLFLKQRKELKAAENKKPARSNFRFEPASVVFAGLLTGPSGSSCRTWR